MARMKKSSGTACNRQSELLLYRLAPRRPAQERTPRRVVLRRSVVAQHERSYSAHTPSCMQLGTPFAVRRAVTHVLVCGLFTRRGADSRHAANIARRESRAARKAAARRQLPASPGHRQRARFYASRHHAAVG